MDILIYLIIRVLILLTGLCQLLLLVRAILSWIPGIGGRFADFIYTVTEPILIPVRKLFDLFGVNLGMSPIDIPFFVTFILLSIMEMMLSLAL